MSARRRLDPVTVRGEAGLRRVHRFKCSRCPAELDIPANTHGGSRNHEDLNRVTQRHGWIMGHNDSHDLCPACVKAAARPHPKPPLKVVEDSTMQSAPPPVADAPKPLTVDDALLIAAKLGEVYINATAGYTPDWTDTRVAEELGVPRAWVAEVRRKQYGGGTGDNEEIRAQTVAALALIKEARLILKAAEEIDQRTRQLIAEAQALRHKADVIERKVIAIHDATR
jgi:hypothetical protein